jgi:hypothetical protein
MFDGFVVELDPSRRQVLPGGYFSLGNKDRFLAGFVRVYVRILGLFAGAWIALDDNNHSNVGKDASRRSANDYHHSRSSDGSPQRRQIDQLQVDDSTGGSGHARSR